MILELILQFLLELVRALLVDELSGRVRRSLARCLVGRVSKDFRLHVHLRNRERLLNRLLTEPEGEP